MCGVIYCKWALITKAVLGILFYFYFIGGHRCSWCEISSIHCNLIAFLYPGDYICCNTWIKHSSNLISFMWQVVLDHFDFLYIFSFLQIWHLNLINIILMKHDTWIDEPPQCWADARYRKTVLNSLQDLPKKFIWIVEAKLVFKSYNAISVINGANITRKWHKMASTTSPTKANFFVKMF